MFTPGRLLLEWGSADGGKRGCTPLPSFSRNASAKLRRSRQNSPIPPRRLVCAAALPPSPYTKKGGGVCYHSLDRQGRRAVSEEGAAARLKKSDFVNKKKPERAGNRGNRYVAREGLGCRLLIIILYLMRKRNSEVKC